MLVCIDREATWLGFLKAPSPGTVPVKNTDCDAHSNSSNFGWYTAPAVASWGSFMFGNCCAYTVLCVLKIDSGVFVKIKLNFVSQ